MSRSLARGAVVAATALACGFALTGCTSGSPAATGTTGAQASASAHAAQGPPPPPPSPLPLGRGGTPPGTLPALAQVDGNRAAAVASAALTWMWTYDTTIDVTPYDAQLRATPFLLPGYAAQLRAVRPLSAPGVWWTALAAHHGYTRATVHCGGDDGGPTATASSASLQCDVADAELGRDGWQGPPQQSVVFVLLTRTPAGWRVGRLTVT